MNFINELFSNSSAPETGMPDIKQFLGPIMDAMAADVKRANDPISRIGDVGTAVLGTVGSGTPYAQNLAALDARRSESIKNNAGLFLSMLGMERQVEQMKAQDRRHQEEMSFRKDEAAARRMSDERNFGLKEREFASEDAYRKARIADLERGDKGSLAKKIAELRAAYPGVDDQTLSGVALGTISIITNPQNGNYAITDKVRGTVREITPTGPARGTAEATTEPKRPGPGESLYDQASKGTGMWSSVGRLWSDVAGQIHPDLVPKFAEAAVKARAALSVASQDLVRALMNNPRFSDNERKDIARRLELSPDMFTAPQTMRLGMHELDKFLESKEEEYSRRLQDVNLSPADRNFWRTSAAAIRDFRRRLGANPDPEKLKGAKYIRDEDGSEIWEMPDGALKRVRR